MRLNLFLWASLAIAGCGGGATDATGTVSSSVQTSPVNAAGAPQAGSGRAYALTSSGGLEVFAGLNSPTGQLQPVLRLQLPRSAPLSATYDPARDRLYIGCLGTGADSALLVYNNASQLSNQSGPSATIPLLGAAPQGMALDETRDILYLGASNGRLARLTTVSTASNSTRATFVTVAGAAGNTTGGPPPPPPPPGGPPPPGAPAPPPGGSPPPAGGNLTSLGALTLHPAEDRLLAAASTAPGNFTSLPSYTPASTAFTFSGLVTPGGLRNAMQLGLADGARLLVLDQETLKRYEPVNNYGGPPALNLTSPGATAFAYDLARDVLYLGSDTIRTYPGASRLSGNLTAANASGPELRLSGGVAKALVVDLSR